jgi:chaperonin GroES
MLNYTKIRPLLNRVLVKRLEAKTKTAGGILLPSEKNTNTRIGVIIDAGTGKYNERGQFIKNSVEVGQYVLLPEYGAVKVPKQKGVETELYIYNVNDILGVVDGDFVKH